MDQSETALRREVCEEYDGERFPLGDVQLFAKSRDILEGRKGGRAVNEKDAMGPSQVTEAGSLNNQS